MTNLLIARFYCTIFSSKAWSRSSKWRQLGDGYINKTKLYILLPKQSFLLRYSPTLSFLFLLADLPAINEADNLCQESICGTRGMEIGGARTPSNAQVLQYRSPVHSVLGLSGTGSAHSRIMYGLGTCTPTHSSYCDTTRRTLCQEPIRKVWASSTSGSPGCGWSGVECRGED